ncbi:MAG: hypothetical protein FuLiV1_gp3 [Hangzhou acrida cinerea lispivirus 1]|uniref:Uncharacterized protein n=1 Tax=Hangzhou acrida cinerea lispivirus 1 TaxID=2905565 RepID=A0A8K1XW24_9MONO|nr:MAG: hypothetical protein QKV03_gp3 [Hangzhou acrida cinerea lispivirus 1]UHK03316.1 MAG: hypothetical protein FuLiV1_gp3 [Hangzhou acrida cinerea lispivirus 1]
MAFSNKVVDFPNTWGMEARGSLSGILHEEHAVTLEVTLYGEITGNLYVVGILIGRAHPLILKSKDEIKKPHWLTYCQLQYRGSVQLVFQLNRDLKIEWFHPFLVPGEMYILDVSENTGIQKSDFRRDVLRIQQVHAHVGKSILGAMPYPVLPGPLND